jgi:glycosyltransferase involved in cell wall biosynthesis
VISLIVPAHNEEAVLGPTLDSLRAAVPAGEPAEIIVVDDDSTDATATVAAARGARVVRVAARHIAAARNAGAAAAAGEFLVFVDADTCVPPATLAAAAAALRAGAVGGGARVLLDPQAPRWARFFWSVVILRLYAGMGLAAGCFLFTTRQCFREAGGFDERYFASEEVHLSRALSRLGRFVVLRETVTTSARKFRMFSAWRFLGWSFGLAGGALRRRHVLWYGGQREESPGGSGRRTPGPADEPIDRRRG